MRSYSSAVRPDSLARSSVTLGEAPVTRLPLEEAAVLDEAAEEALEQLEPVRAAHRRLGRALGMRHEAEHVTLQTHDARDVLERAVGIRRPRNAPVGLCVAEDHLVPRPELAQRLGVRVVLALAVGDRHREHLPEPEPPREDRKSTRLNSSHPSTSYAVFCLKKKKQKNDTNTIKKQKPKVYDKN